MIPSPGWNVTVADVRSSSGGVPALARPAESAIEKQAACAAAISSSGLVCRRSRPPSAPPRSRLRAEARRSSSSRSCRCPRAGCPARSPLRGDRLPLRHDFDARRFAANVLSSSSTSRSARIETSSWSSVGSRVVSRCSHSPGASSVISTRLPWCLPAKRISSYASPAITGSSRMRVAISQYQVGPAEEREDEDRDHHHPEQERRPAARMDQRVPLHDLRLERLARLVGVDRLVLGRVVLEDAPQVGQQRDERRGRRRRSRRGSAPRRCTKYAPVRIGSRSVISAGPTLKTRDREPDRDQRTRRRARRARARSSTSPSSPSSLLAA